MTSPTVDTVDLDQRDGYLSVAVHDVRVKGGIGAPHRDIMRAPTRQLASVQAAMLWVMMRG
jgi:hypothetical protein